MLKFLDLSFERSITPFCIKLIYIFSIIISILGFIGTFFRSIQDGSGFMEVFAAFVVGLIGCFFFVLIVRVFLEIIFAVFKASSSQEGRYVGENATSNGRLETSKTSKKG